MKHLPMNNRKNLLKNVWNIIKSAFMQEITTQLKKLLIL